MFFTKKTCMQNISHVYCDDIMNCEPVLSHIMFVYPMTCGLIHDRSILFLGPFFDVLLDTSRGSIRLPPSIRVHEGLPCFSWS
jgi:hypothetical protein